MDFSWVWTGTTAPITESALSRYKTFSRRASPRQEACRGRQLGRLEYRATPIQVRTNLDTDFLHSLNQGQASIPTSVGAPPHPPQYSYRLPLCDGGCLTAGTTSVNSPSHHGALPLGARHG